MDRSGHQLFTHARFAGDQHIKIGVRHNIDFFLELLHYRRQTNHLIAIAGNG